MTLAGRSCEAAARSGLASALVRKNSDLTLRSITLSQPLSGKFVEIRAPGRAGIVDEDVELRLAA